MLSLILLVVACVNGRFVQTDEQYMVMEQDIELPAEELPALVRSYGCDKKNETDRCTVDRWQAKRCSCCKHECTCTVNPPPFSSVDPRLTMKCSYDNFHEAWSCKVMTGHARTVIYQNLIPRNVSSTVDSNCVRKLNRNMKMEICVIIECQDASLQDPAKGKIPRGCPRLTIYYDSTKSGINDEINVNFGCFRIANSSP